MCQVRQINLLPCPETWKCLNVCRDEIGAVSRAGGCPYRTLNVGANLVWTGSDGSIWDTNTTPNWSNGGATDVFAVGDDVTFDDSSTVGTVTLSGTLDPGAVTFNNGNT